MFLKVLLGIYLLSIAFSSILFLTATADCTHRWKEKHPDFVSKKKYWFDKVRTFVSLVFTFGCPALNTLVALYLLFAYEEYCEELMKRMEELYAQRPEANQEVL